MTKSTSTAWEAYETIVFPPSQMNYDCLLCNSKLINYPQSFYTSTEIAYCNNSSCLLFDRSDDYVAINTQPSITQYSYLRLYVQFKNPKWSIYSITKYPPCILIDQGTDIERWYIDCNLILKELRTLELFQ